MQPKGTVQQRTVHRRTGVTFKSEADFLIGVFA